MVKQPDYIIFKPAPDPIPQGEAPQSKVYPMTHGVWQREALDTLKMYAPDEGSFSPVGGPQTAACSPAAQSGAASLKLALPPHQESLRFLAEDARLCGRPVNTLFFPTLAPAPPQAPEDIVSLTQGKLYDPPRTILKADDFPGRIQYKDGGLYPPDADQSDAPNYRKMKNQPVHGVGQPTREGFKKVLEEAGRGNKPVMWVNTRAEAVIYIDGQPYNLRELGGGNLDLKKGASAEEMARLEQELRDRLIARGEVEITREVPVLENGKPVKDENGNLKTEPRTEKVKLDRSNCQTTEDVVEELKKDFQFEYRRVPISDEKTPDPNALDEIRGLVEDMKKTHPGEDVQYVFNCHQGRGRTTTAMVAAALSLEGKPDVEVPGDPDKAKERANRIIDDNEQMQNLRTVVDEYRAKGAKAATREVELRLQARDESDPEKRTKLEDQADVAARESKSALDKAAEFTKRHALMLKFSEYVLQFGAGAKTPTFEAWMSEQPQKADLGKRWNELNVALGLPAVAPETAFA